MMLITIADGIIEARRRRRSEIDIRGNALQRRLSWHSGGADQSPLSSVAAIEAVSILD